MKYVFHHIGGVLFLSRPARGAWIEIFAAATGMQPTLVAPRTGRVD